MNRKTFREKISSAVGHCGTVSEAWKTGDEYLADITVSLSRTHDFSFRVSSLNPAKTAERAPGTAEEWLQWADDCMIQMTRKEAEAAAERMRIIRRNLKKISAENHPDSQNSVIGNKYDMLRDQYYTDTDEEKGVLWEQEVQILDEIEQLQKRFVRIRLHDMWQCTTDAEAERICQKMYEAMRPGEDLIMFFTDLAEKIFLSCGNWKETGEKITSMTPDEMAEIGKGEEEN